MIQKNTTKGQLNRQDYALENILGTHVGEEALPIMLGRHQGPVPRVMRMGVGWGVNLNAETRKVTI